ncbi:MAG: ATP synthase subunit I [Clostridia bacterium]|nr:ATP synthase subunit I [Clostridia bacterium]
MDKALVREIKKVAIGVLMLAVLQALVVWIAFGVHIPMLLGTVLGSLCAIVNFFLTALNVQKAVDKSESGAKLSMVSGYYCRLAIIAAAMFLAIKMPWLNIFTTAIPLIFPRLVITGHSLVGQLKKDGGEQEK